MAETRKDLSQYDLGGVLKSAHQDENQALRVTSANTSVPPSYSRVDLTYNASKSVTNAKFYRGDLPEVTEIKPVADVAGSLNNTYFTIYSENDESQYNVWYNVSGGGIDPAPVGSVGIEVMIETGDTAAVVTFATKVALDKIADFKAVTISNTKIKVTNVRHGLCTPVSDFNSGFAVVQKRVGTECLLKSVDIPFDGNSKYIFNTQEKKFEVESISALGIVEVDIDADSGDNLSISRHENYRNITDDVDLLGTALSTSTYTEIWSYVATEDLRVRILKVKADTLGSFRIKIESNIKDYFRTSPIERNCTFSFIEDLEVLTGDTLTIEFLPERLRITNYNFFFRTEGYVK